MSIGSLRRHREYGESQPTAIADVTEKDETPASEPAPVESTTAPKPKQGKG
jgi:hypothetical protein